MPPIGDLHAWCVNRLTRLFILGFGDAVVVSVQNPLRLNERSVPLSSEARQLSACTNNVLVPFVQSTIPGVDDHANTNQQVRYQLQREFPGLAGESRLSDGNNQSFHGSAVASPQKIQPVPPTEIDQPPPRRPDIPCETQQTPDLHAAKAVVASGPAGGLVLPSVSIPPVAKFKAAPLMKAGKMMQQFEQKQNARENAKAKAGAKAKRVSR
jgi:hypothetical protein